MRAFLRFRSVLLFLVAIAETHRADARTLEDVLAELIRALRAGDRVAVEGLRPALAAFGYESLATRLSDPIDGELDDRAHADRVAFRRAGLRRPVVLLDALRVATAVADPGERRRRLDATLAALPWAMTSDRPCLRRFLAELVAAIRSSEGLSLGAFDRRVLRYETDLAQDVEEARRWSPFDRSRAAEPHEIDSLYHRALAAVFRRGVEEPNARTGRTTVRFPGLTIRLNLSQSFPLVTLRRIPVKLFAAEIVWMLSGRKDVAFLAPFTHVWDGFADPDGNVETAYGHRMRHHFGRDQIVELVRLLERDPSSRHGVVMLWDPGDDGLASGTPKPNVPCPVSFTAQIVRGRLMLHLKMRSNDMMLGHPHDVAGFALLGRILAERLSVDPGILTVTISDAHVYGTHQAALGEILARPVDRHAPIRFALPENAFARGLAGDATLVTDIAARIDAVYRPQGKLTCAMELVH